LKRLEEIFRNNEKWIRKKLSADPKYFEKLSRGQNPLLLYIGCSDSRVAAEELMGLEPGELFVHRNIANLVVSTDSNLNAVIQYAVEYLQIKHIILCGHYECAGVKAALHPSDLGQLNSWLQTLRDVLRLHQSELDAITDQGRKYDRLVELNVIEQCINVVKNYHVQRSWYKNQIPVVHGWVFDIRTGKLIDLKLNMATILRDISGIYDLKPAKNQRLKRL
jgi:carbonic anhydrase